jgi:hypothetical protein
MTDHHAYNHRTTLKDIEDIICGHPINASQELFVELIAYMDNIEDMEKFLRVNGKLNQVKVGQVKEKLLALIFWQEILEEHVELLRLETERAIMNVKHLLSHDNTYFNSKFNNVPITDLSHVTAKEMKQHEGLRKIIKKGLWEYSPETKIKNKKIWT